MQTTELLVYLNDRGIVVETDGEKLKIRSISGPVSEDILQLIRASKQQLIQFLIDSDSMLAEDLNQNTSGFSEIREVIEPITRDGDLALSYGQQSLWFMSQLTGGGATWNMPTALTLNGSLDVESMQRSLDTIILRHEILRTTYSSYDGKTMQNVQPPDALRINVIDLSHLGLQNEPCNFSPQQMDLVCQLRSKEAGEPFDLSADLMIRVTRLILSPQLNVILFTLHHIVADGWSIALFIKEFVTLYAAYCQGKSNPLSPLTFQYADYAHWQRNMLKGKALDKSLKYWLTHLEGIPDLHSLMLDRPRPARQDFRGQMFTHTVSNHVLQNLKDFASNNNASLFMALQGAFAVLLGRWSLSRDIVMGSPIAGRECKELQPLIGFFVNSLVLRTKLQPSQTFRELLRQSRDNALDAFEHQAVPFEMLVDKLQIERNLSQTPVFQVVFSLMNNQKPELNLQNLTIESLEDSIERSKGGSANLTVDAAKVDIELTAEETTEGLVLRWLYADALFDRATIINMAESFSVLLQNAVAMPDQNLDDFDIVPIKHQQYLQAWQRGVQAEVSRLCLHQLIEEQVALTPRATAVIADEGKLTYQDLNSRSNQLAHYLIEQGVVPGMLVGVCCDHSLTLVIALLGILKSGGAYIPLNPADPNARLEDIIEHSGVNLVLTRQQCLKKLSTANKLTAEKTLICLNDSKIELQLASYSLANPRQENTKVTQQDLAYVIYTSGTTGRPKGVMISHQSLVNYLQYAYSHYIRDDLRGSVVSSPLSFDATITSLFAPLCVGKYIELLPDNDQLLLRLADYLFDDDDALLFKLTPAHLAALEPLGGQNLRAKHVVVIGGEQLTTATLKPWVTARLPKATFINEYGPTETVVGCSVYQIDEASGHQWLDGEAIPIGKPIDNVQLFVLNPALKQQPIGTPGELYIGGLGLAQGYLQQQQLTGEKFVDKPLWDEGATIDLNCPISAKKLYKTGDRVRWLPDGNLEFLGRIDEQIKIRGFRIEPSEIEYHLHKHSCVTQALVVCKNVSREKQNIDETNNQQLVAYLVLTAIEFTKIEQETEREREIIDEIKDLLGAHLPTYMIPAAYVFLPQFPLTNNGKIDKSSLPDPLGDDRFNSYIEPSTINEREMVALWQEILQCDKISVTANFFTMGGHSLLATQLISAVSKHFNKSITLTTLFEQSTVRELCTWLESQPFVFHQNIPQIDRTQRLPLSFAQQRLWFIDQLEGGSLQYVMTLPLTLTGNLNRNALQESLDIILARHEVLRTTFPINEGEASQYIHPPQSLFVETVDLSNTAIQERDNVVAQQIHRESKRGFVLTDDFPWRVSLLILSPLEHIVLFSMHHIASDGWSMDLLIREFSACYTACCKGEPNPLAPLSVQYADYAYWQREFLEGFTLQMSLAYWQNQLKGIPRVHSLPLDKIRPAQQDFVGKTFTSWVAQPVLNQLYDLAAQHDATLYMVLQTAFALLLSRWSGETDIVVGTPVAGRSHKEIEPLIGFFVNTLVLRTDLSIASNFTELLLQGKKNALQAYENQAVPFESLVDGLQVERSLSHAPVFQIVFDLQNNRKSELQLPQLQISEFAFGDNIANYDLELHASETNNGLCLNWVFAHSLFEVASIETMSASFALLLEQITLYPDIELGLLNLIAPETALRLNQLNQAVNVVQENKCIHELFEQCVVQNPDALAVMDENGSHLTYAELNAQANQLAHYLREQNVGPDTIIVLCLERSLNLFVGILAIVKAGAAYLPIDPNYPEERIAYLLENSAADMVLTDRDTLSLLPLSDEKIFLLDKNIREKLLHNYSCNNIAKDSLGLSSEHLAYVIYTSGSTGKPMGVMNSHGALVNLCSWHQRHYKLDEDCRATHLASIGFDAAVWEIWPYLLSGSRLVIVSDSTRNNLDLLLDVLVQHSVTHCFMPTGLLEAMCESLSDAKELRVLLTGGDKLSLSHLPNNLNAQLVNHYGPTEAAVVTTFCNVNPTQGTPPIGVPIDNVQVYVLNSHGNEQPIGVVGELYIGGAGLAKGYLHQPQLTQERFRAHNIVEFKNKRLYKTGDLVRWRQDGLLEFMGRIDDQVKIRGYRIEPNEIEACLNRDDRIAQSLVIVSGETSAKKLTAYIVPNIRLLSHSIDPDRRVENEDMEQHEYELLTQDQFVKALKISLKKLLPDYMIPTAFVLLTQLPLTANGKIDKRVLPQPEESRVEYVPPDSKTEKRLATLWETILKLEQVSVTANFFELGGHSLLAARLASAIHSEFAKPLTVKAIFEHSSIRELAACLDESATTDIQTICSVTRQQSLLLSFAQQRLWLLDQIDGGSAHYNIPGALRLSGQLNQSALEKAFSTIVERHESLRTCFIVGDDGQPIQQIQTPSRFDVPIIDMSMIASEQQELTLTQRIMEEANRPFNLSGDLMLRVQLIKVVIDEHILLVTMHHIASDGWSMSILINEFSALYSAYFQGQENPLKPLTIQYADYAHWQRNWLQGEVLDKQVDYWTTQLANLPVVHSLPLDHARPSIQRFAGSTFHSDIDTKTSKALNGLCQAQGATLFMGLHAAFSVLLSRYSNETDIVVGSPIANREQAEVANLIGFFVNTLVLRSDISGNPCFRDLLLQSKALLLDAYAHQQVPFEQIVERLQPERSLSHSPLFQIMLVLQNNEEGELTLPGLTLGSVESGGAGIAKFDLTLNVTESEEGLWLGWEYNTDLFEESTVERMSGHFGLLLESLVSRPDASVFGAEMLPETERQQLLVEWNNTAVDYPKDKCIHELFEAQVSTNPNAIAVIFEEQQLTYAELNQRANQLAHYLINEKQVKPDTLVGICVERSLEMVVGILAILKAGGAYVPLDPEYPEARLAYMLDDASLNTVLTQLHLRATTPVSDAQAVCLDDETLQHQLHMHSTQNPDTTKLGLTSNHLAYVIYTSGSTGNPKGVMVEQHALVNRIDWMDREYGCSSTDRILQKTPFSFDVSVWEFVWPLTAGAGMVLAKPEGHKDPVYLSNLIRNQHITKLHFVPSMLGSMLALGDLSQCTTLRQVFCSGEALSLHHVAEFQSLCAWAELHNLYGPTEAAIDVSYWDCSQLSADVGSVPIGRPIQNIQLHILDHGLNPVPAGVAGELHIGGVGLARGYLNRAELTAEKFIPNPFYDKNNPASSERLYKTGDLVRWLPDGNLEYLGRMDNQVKIRGFRIELGEIESALLEYSELSAAVVLIKSDATIDNRIIAYITIKDMFGYNLTELSNNELILKIRGKLSLKLPQYMIPHQFVVVDKIPLTPNGKIDRAALLRKENEAITVLYVPPSTKEEKLTVDIWSSILDIDPEKLSLTDNVFSLGGNSLLAVKFISEVNKKTGLDLPLSLAFEGQTIQEFSKYIANEIN